MSVTVRTSGPIFDAGLCDAATWDFCEESEEELAERGARYVREFASSSFQHGTGNYVSRIRAEERGSVHVVTDQRSDYGPWLAGVSKRNRSTRFAGYRHWRQAAELLDSEAVQIVEPKLRGYRRKLGGK